MTLIQTSDKSNEKEVYSNLKHNREYRKPKFNLGQFVRTAHTKKVFSKGDITNYTLYKLYSILSSFIQKQKSYATLYQVID